MYIQCLHAFASLSGVFSLFSPLNILHTFFCLSALSLFPPCCRAPPRSPPPPLPQARGHPCFSLLPSLPSLRLSSRCLLLLSCVLWWLPCLVLSPSLPLSPVGRAPEVLRRPSVCPAVCPAPAVTRPPSGARRCDSVGRCTAYISPALSVSPRHVLPCVPLSVPWLPSVCPCVCAAVVCRLVAITAYTPLCPGRRRFGAASVM